MRLTVQMPDYLRYILDTNIGRYFGMLLTHRGLISIENTFDRKQISPLESYVLPERKRKLLQKAAKRAHI